MVTGTNPTYIGGTGHRPLPMATDVGVRAPHKPGTPKRTGLDWSKVGNGSQGATVTPLPVNRVCKECRLDTDGELRDGMCAVCCDIATERFAPTGTAPHERPMPAPARTTTEPTQEVVTVATPDFPQYIVDVAVVMRDSEGHPDPAVRAARKAVANAMVGLDKALRAVDTTPVPVAAVTKTPPAATAKPTGKRKYVRLTQEQTEELIRRYVENGESQGALSKAFNIAQSSVSRVLRQAGVATRSSNFGAKP